MVADSSFNINWFYAAVLYYFVFIEQKTIVKTLVSSFCTQQYTMTAVRENESGVGANLSR